MRTATGQHSKSKAILTTVQRRRPTIEQLEAEARILACISRAKAIGMHDELAELCERSLAVLEAAGRQA